MILPYLKIERQDESQIEKELRLWIDPIYVKTPLFIGMNRNKIKNNSSYKIEIFGNGDIILDQIPASNEKIKEGETIFLYT
jgi:hypothetical protein